jgi:predicted nucleotidyltransferase
MRFGLKEQTIEQITKTLMQFPFIEKTIVYGSRAKGNQKYGSDIDLCLFGKGLDQQTLYRIETALDDLDLPYTFDICSYDALSNQELKDHINRVGVPFY